MKEIQLTRGMVALVDDEDYDRINAHKWYAGIASKKGMQPLFYAQRQDYSVGSRSIPDRPRYVRCVMHRVILGIADKRLTVDHRNNNGLDNRKENLRICTPSTNQANRRQSKNNKSGFRGVYLDKSSMKWVAGITANGKRLKLGRFAAPEEAARAYDKAAIEHFGEFAAPNFQEKA